MIGRAVSSGRGPAIARSAQRRRAAAITALGCAAAWSLAAAPAHADEIRAKEWPLAFLNASAANRLTTGSGVTVALLDSGVMGQRVDLTGQVTTGPDYAGGVERPGQTGWGEHGTCMASIIAGHGRGGSDGMMGIAPGAHVLSIRVIRDDDAPDINGPTTSDSPISDGIHYAVDHGAQVISMSLGGGDASAAASDSTPEAEAIRYALQHNVVVVVAAGNSADKGNAIQFPGAERGVISVGAVDSAARHAAFSTTSWDVSVSAPGVNLPCDAAASDNEYMLGDGTSQATAYVAGIAALVKAKNPGLSPAQVRDILESTARNRPAGGRNDQLGFGIVDPVAALKAAAGAKGATETPAAGPGPANGHFGYGPAAVVTESASSLGPMPRAIIGGIVLLLIAFAAASVMMRRARREVLAALPPPLPPAPPYPTLYSSYPGAWPQPQPPQEQPQQQQPQPPQPPQPPFGPPPPTGPPPSG